MRIHLFRSLLLAFVAAVFVLVWEGISYSTSWRFRPGFTRVNVAALAAGQGIATTPSEVLSPAGVGGWRPVYLLGTVPGGSKELFFAWIDLSSQGMPVAHGPFFRVTHTPLVDESRMVSCGHGVLALSRREGRLALVHVRGTEPGWWGRWRPPYVEWFVLPSTYTDALFMPEGFSVRIRLVKKEGQSFEEARYSCASDSWEGVVPSVEREVMRAQGPLAKLPSMAQWLQSVDDFLAAGD